MRRTGVVLIVLLACTPGVRGAGLLIPEAMGYADDELYKRRDAHLKAV